MCPPGGPHNPRFCAFAEYSASPNVCLCCTLHENVRSRRFTRYTAFSRCVSAIGPRRVGDEQSAELTAGPHVFCVCLTCVARFSKANFILCCRFNNAAYVIINQFPISFSVLRRPVERCVSVIGPRRVGDEQSAELTKGPHVFCVRRGTIFRKST